MDEPNGLRVVTQYSDLWDFLDLPPEFRRYRDEGCDVAPSCLKCPFPRCLEEDAHGKKKMITRRRAQEMNSLFTSGQRNIGELASIFGVSRRTVERSLMRSSFSRLPEGTPEDEWRVSQPADQPEQYLAIQR